MAPIVIDQYYLTISFLITLAWQVTGFAIAWTLQFDKITGKCGPIRRYWATGANQI